MLTPFSITECNREEWWRRGSSAIPLPISLSTIGNDWVSSDDKKALN